MAEVREVLARRQSGRFQGEVTCLELVRTSLERIDALDRRGPAIRAMIEINSEAEDIARALDAESAAPSHRSTLRGIPVLLKDNINTADLMGTTAGSLALVGSRPRNDAHVAGLLREAGAIVIGKANMSEWANFRSHHSSSGWSARGGQALNPHVLDRTPCGSSSGSASAVAAGYVTASLGTETSGSILCPAAINGVVGVKPTVGLTSRAGVIPISHSQDTVGPFCRTVADAAAILTVIAGRDDRDPATHAAPTGVDYASEVDPEALRGARIGVPREKYFGYDVEVDGAAGACLRRMAELGAEIVDPVVIPSMEQLRDEKPMIEVLLYEFKADLNAYLGRLPAPFPVRSLAGIIAFNAAHEAEEMPHFEQDLFELAQEKGPLTDQAYLDALSACRRLSREEGIDAVMDLHGLDALVAPTTGTAWKIDLENGDPDVGGVASLPAMAGYPAISLPVGFAGSLPIGLTFFGRAFSEPLLLRLAYSLEEAIVAFRWPRFLPQQPST